LAGVPGIEPGNDRVKVYCLTTWLYPNNGLVEAGGFEPPNPKELIYSQLRLAASLSLQGDQLTGTTWWMLRGSNPRPPPCKGDALPAELNIPWVYACLLNITNTTFLVNESRSFFKKINNLFSREV
jgi:hypothetical protein